MNRSWTLFITVLLMAVLPSLAAQPFRGIELHPDAPESVLKTFVENGVNSVVIPFCRQGDLNDPAFVKTLARWATLCAKHKLRCFVAIRLFGPYDYVGSKGGFRTAIEGIALHAGICPTDERYWRQHATQRIQRIAQLAKQHNLAGALFYCQATLGGPDYNTLFCFCDGCWDAFVKSPLSGDPKLASYKINQRRQWIRTSTRAADYFQCLSNIVERHSTEAAAAGRTGHPDLCLGIYGYLDSWFYHSLARGLAADATPPITIMADYGKASFARLRTLVQPLWKKQNPAFHPVACLPLDFYLPRDVQNQIAELDTNQRNFLLTNTEALWQRARDVFHVYPPNGSPDAFAAAVRNGLEGKNLPHPTFFNVQHHSKITPRIGAIYGTGLSGLFSAALQKITAGLQSPLVRLSTQQLDAWSNLLPALEIVVVLPGAVDTNAQGLQKAAPAFHRFLRNGGILIVLGAANDKQAAWLASIAPNLKTEGETRTGLKQGSLAKDTAILEDPVHIQNFPPLMWRFKSFAPAYTPLAKDNQDHAYLLSQPVGRGLVLAAAGPTIPVELLINAWCDLAKQGRPFSIDLLPGSPPIRFGANRLLLGVAEAEPSAGNCDLTVDLIDTTGQATTHRSPNVALAGDGLQIPLEYHAAGEGVGHIVVTLTDPDGGALLHRSFIDLLHEHRVEILQDKNYYTDEPHAVLRLDYCDNALRDARVQANIRGKTLDLKPTGGDVRFAELPIADLPAGQHAIEIAFLKNRKPAYAAQLVLRKELPFPTAVKILYHRSCVLEVKGKPFFPFGCYGIDPSQQADLLPLGVNTTVHGKPHRNAALWTAGTELRGFARDPNQTSDSVQKILRTPDYEKLLAWYMYDEPAGNNHSSESVMATYVAGQKKDPYHPQMSVYIGSRTFPLYPDYVPTADCVMMDHYPLPIDPCESFGRHFASLARAARGRRNLWAVPQCFDWREIGVNLGPYKPDSLHPTGPEALNFIYQSIVEGAGAITFWTYRYVASDPRRHEGFRNALAEGAKLANLVTNGTVVQPPRVKPLGAQIHCRAFRIENQIHLVAVNPTLRPAAVEFSAPYLQGKPLRQSIPTARTLDKPADTFKPLEGKVYVVDAP